MQIVCYPFLSHKIQQTTSELPKMAGLGDKSAVELLLGVTVLITE
jgi:hypothetical protein